MVTWFPSPVRWLSWLQVLCLCLWHLVLATKRLDFCSASGDFIVNGSRDINGTEPVYGEIKMPSIIYCQTSTRDAANPVHVNFAWSAVGFPTLFVSQSFGSESRNCSSFKINETGFLDSQAHGSVNIAGAWSNDSLAIVFRRLIMFDGGKSAKASSGFNSSATLTRNETVYKSVYLNHSIEWSYSPRERYIVGRSSNFSTLTFKFQLPWMEGDSRISYFPKTKYTRNSTVFDITLYKFNYTKQDKDFKRGRIALEMVMVNGQAVNKYSTRVTSTEDDEYTPSVFRTWEYLFGPPNYPYLQWKPISYQNHKRVSTISQEANIVFPRGEAVDFLDGKVPRSLASALFSDSTTLNGTAMYMVFGTDGDDTYLNTPHLTWTAVVGYGRVPKDTISIEVIIIIIVALGIPALLIFLGSFYVTYKKKPWQSIARGIRRLRRVEGYERIN